MTENAQQIIAANVAARGYRDGWTPEQFIVRQLAKLTEELGESLDQIGGLDKLAKNLWIDAASGAGFVAGKLFDGSSWDGVFVEDPGVLCAELADMLVVLFAAADALGFDIVQAAIDKSAADVARGVR